MDDDLKTPITENEIAQTLLDPFQNALETSGITEKYLVRKLKRELNAKETKTVKIKGAVDKTSLPRGFKVVAESGKIKETEGGEVFSDGDTVIHYDVVEWSTRQKARMDAHKLMGHYPAEKRELTGPNGGPVQVAHNLSDEDRKIVLAAAKINRGQILEDHYADIISS